VSGDARPNKGALIALLEKVQSARRQIEANIPYVQECATEQLEQKLSDAMIEFESYISRAFEAKGLAGMQAEAPRLSFGSARQLTTPVEKEDGEN
jgi:hypothetical protein